MYLSTRQLLSILKFLYFFVKQLDILQDFPVIFMILYDKRIHALKAFFEQMPSKFAPAKQYVSSCILHRKLNQNHIFLQKIFNLSIFVSGKIIHGLGKKIRRSFDEKKP